MKISIAILGATGYTGSELIRLLQGHPYFDIAHLAAHSQAGKKVCEVLPGIGGHIADMTLAAADAPMPDEVELVFTALPHGAAANSVERALQQGKRVVDLSADFRHQSESVYREAYGSTHPHPELFTEAVYGLSEHARERVSNARLVANPGCYPTSVLLPLIPLLKAGAIDSDPIIIDAKSGASGAGRTAKTNLLFCEVNEGLAAYGLPRHRHAWEMDEWALGFGGKEVNVRFVPHILPMTRGMLSTLHLSGDNPEQWLAILQEAYADEPFVRILSTGSMPGTKGVNGSNRCDIGVSVIGPRQAVVVSCIDNLLKGASGQALQNANIMFGFEETLGLSIHATWP
jgi:N-acetyl-gamma-glutamyl-phosphate reductase